MLNIRSSQAPAVQHFQTDISKQSPADMGYVFMSKKTAMVQSKKNKARESFRTPEPV